jgi:hypothetical protein
MLSASIGRKILLLLVLIALITTPRASAAGPRPESPRSAQAVEDVPFLGNFWIFLRSVWGKEGCNIDPWGRCVKEPTQNPKIGCHIDPWGHCIP